ncbi:Stk1 family PASTA domain-containing Ser/Thr kinase [Pseudolysinimonas sp.]|uniref:Stk1 family PASTA domain-containing Ser/Thr kinase n=1 Tax=Pseudolysinimonas sp. TaxID=2680009 RepID=UPI00286C9A99|nr:Stk1 family PASTA domain-containing Ser/Thr kinase [Pseudolysinimonas sp.]
MSTGTTDPLIGRLIDGRYQVRSRIARGGMATVYLATDLRLERRVAVKVMHGHLADDSQFKQRFIQEARSAARLAHQNVVNVFDQGQDNESAYLVMEYLPGITLRDLLEEYGSLTPQQMIDITEAVLSGLGAAHKAGILHRDLKPENVLLADDGRIKIGDFGLARATSANTATGAALLGTIAYLSPELVTRGLADTRSDIYAVGIMMYEMLTGEQPFTGEQPMQIAYRHANEPLPAPSSKNPKVPRELDELVLWATAKDPDQRPADARALLEQVRDTEALLDLPAGEPARRQKTQVLPAASGGARHTAPTDTSSLGAPVRPERPFSEAATQVLGSRRPPGGPGTELALAESPARPARTRRWIPLVAILGALLLAASGVGWWFIFGPGARVTIPTSIESLTFEQAKAQLEDLGLDVADQPGTIDSPTVAKDLVAQTEPEIGTAVEPGSSVVILLSTGPQLLPINLDQGMSQAEAEAVVQEHWTLEETDVQFHAAVAAGQLIDALGAGGVSLLEATEYGELQPITLVVSAGPIPDLTGKTPDEARAALAAVDLVAADSLTRQSYHDTVPEGTVIGLVESASPIRPGDEVALDVSRGPEPVAVPAIVGMSWTDARAALEAAGLGYAFDREIDEDLAETFPNSSRVTRSDPDPGVMVRRGDIVTVRLTVG